MLSLHHTHLYATDVDRSIAFWRDHFRAVVVLDAAVAGSGYFATVRPGTASD
jgi:catechol 2,3-dioxygenase-like lactoylglutathione lyase family enzyme